MTLAGVLITGGCGFIGVNLVQALLASSRPLLIRVLDDLSTGQWSHLEPVLVRQGLRPMDGDGAVDRWAEDQGRRVELVVGDVRDPHLAVRVTAGVSAVVHLAAQAGVVASLRDPDAGLDINVRGTVNYLQAAFRNGVKAFVFASSSAPLGEKDQPFHEEMAPDPLSPYGASKLAGEGYCRGYAASYGLPTTVLRFANVYGPHSHHKGSVVAEFIRRALARQDLVIYGDGSQTRDFVHVRDLGRAVCLAVSHPRPGQMFQVGSGLETSVGEVVRRVLALAAELTGTAGAVRHEDWRRGEVRRSSADIAKARRVLGYEPRVPLPEGLRDTFEWFLGSAAG